ncbi:MAG: ABC transporter substrate-binding protein [Opitutae bacterium]|nr:ABC transporter substrate-binding protein [Opitutae bacterium]
MSPRASFGCLLSLVLAASLSAQETIKVGEFASLTGKQASFGQTNHRGVLTAVEELNAAGGVLGRKIELVTEDTRSLQGEAATVVKKLISRDKVAAIIGETGSSAALEAAPLCQQAGVPMMSATATNARVTEAGDFIFRACFIDPFQGTVLAKFAADTLKVRRVAVLVASGNAYSVGLVKYFRERFPGEIAAEQKYSEGDKDFRAQLTAVKAAEPDAIFASGDYAESALICKQARELGLTVPIFGGDTWDSPALTQIGGRAVEGTYFSAHFSPDSTDPLVKSFVQRFAARWQGTVPDTGTSLGYDAMMLLADAMRRAGSTEGKKIRDALAATKDFPGVTGRITLDAQRNAAKSAVIFTVRDGQFRYVETVAP